MEALARLQSNVPLSTRQACASGDAVALVVEQLPPNAAGDYDLLRVTVDAEFDNSMRHRVGVLEAHPRPAAGARVLGTACVPGAVAYYATWHLVSSRELTIGVGIHASIGGADHGLRNFDLEDAEDSASSWITSFGYGQEGLLSPSACVVAEVYGHNRGADAIIQLHDGASALTIGATAEDSWFVPAGGTFHRSLPPRIFTRGLIVARSTNPGTLTPENTGDHFAHARLLVR